MIKNTQKLLIVAFLFLLLQTLIQPVLADEKIGLDFFYSSNCASCEEKLVIIEDDFEKNETYDNILIITKKDIDWAFERINKILTTL